MSSRLDPDKAHRSVRPDLGLNSFGKGYQQMTLIGKELNFGFDI